MFYTIADDLIFYRLLSFIKKFSNFELKLLKYFYKKTNGIYSESIILIDQFIFFFVKSENYFNSKQYLKSMRRELTNKKVLIIRVERIFINVLFSFFPDVCIHDIKIDTNSKSNQKEISIYFLIAEERGIAIGRNGDYIKVVNKIFKNYINFENNDSPLAIKCRFMN